MKKNQKGFLSTEIFIGFGVIIVVLIIGYFVANASTTYHAKPVLGGGSYSTKAKAEDNKAKDKKTNTSSKTEYTYTEGAVVDGFIYLKALGIKFPASEGIKDLQYQIGVPINPTSELDRTYANFTSSSLTNLSKNCSFGSLGTVFTQTDDPANNDMPPAFAYKKIGNFYVVYNRSQNSCDDPKIVSQQQGNQSDLIKVAVINSEAY